MVTALGGAWNSKLPISKMGNPRADVPDFCFFCSPEAFQGLGCLSRGDYGLLGIWELSCIHS